VKAYPWSSGSPGAARVGAMKPSLDELNAREARVIKAAKEVGTVEAIKAAMKGG
jgi:hypothetical protein